MNLKKVFLLVLAFGFVAIVAYAQQYPLTGTYVTADSNARVQYITIAPARSVNDREVTLQDSNRRTICRVTMQYSSRNNTFNGQITSGQYMGTFHMQNIASDNFTISTPREVQSSTNAIYGRMSDRY